MSGICSLAVILLNIVCLQALYASTSISTGMKGATKAMVAMNKVCASGVVMEDNQFVILRLRNPT